MHVDQEDAGTQKTALSATVHWEEPDLDVKEKFPSPNLLSRMMLMLLIKRQNNNEG